MHHRARRSVLPQAVATVLLFTLILSGSAQDLDVRIGDAVYRYKREGELWAYCPDPVVYWVCGGNAEETLQRYPFAMALGFFYPDDGKPEQAVSFPFCTVDVAADPGGGGEVRKNLPFTVTWQPTAKGWYATALFKSDKAGGLTPEIRTHKGTARLYGAHVQAQVEYDRDNERVVRAHFHYTLNASGASLKPKRPTRRLTSQERLRAIKRGGQSKEEKPQWAKVPRLGRGKRSEFDVTLVLAGVIPPEEQDGINGAIEKGAWYLKRNYLANAAKRVELARAGKLRTKVDPKLNAEERKKAEHSSRQQYQVGRDAMVALALSESDVLRDEPAMAEFLDTVFDRRHARLRTYEAGIVLMLLESAVRHIEYETEREMAARKWAGFGEAVRRHLVGMTKDHRWSYDRRTTSGDNSNTQYAFLGLRAAAKVGLKTDKGDWKRMTSAMLADMIEVGNPVRLELEGEDLFGLTVIRGETSQDKDEPYDEPVSQGGWSYRGNKYAESEDKQDPEKAKQYRPTLNMTAAILSDLAIAVENTEEPCPDHVRDAMRSGWAYLQENLRSMRSPNGYKFYGIERIGIFYKFDTIGGLDWYRDGAAALVRTQRPDGSWDMRYGGDVDTAYALLFLKRATVSISL